jgi:hypothetical protein
MSLHENVISRLRVAVDPREFDPFPHFYAEKVFPRSAYNEILYALEDLPYHSEKFANRQFADPSGIQALDFMKTPAFLKNVLNLFPDQMEQRFKGKTVKFIHDLRLVRDNQFYKIGPHTDAPWKVVSLLFYLPTDNSIQQYGTCIYQPTIPGFTCPGGPHYPFEGFTEVDRAPFLPNSCFGFWKTDNSFHGVPPIPIPIERNVLLYNIYQKEMPRSP